MKLVSGQRDDRSTLSAKVVSKLTDALDGVEQNREDSALPGTIYMQYGFKLTNGLQSCVREHKPYIIIDHGYFRDRERCFSVSINGFHGLSMKVEAIDGRPAREHPPLKPWKTGGEYVYVYGQLQNDRAVRGLHIETWLRKTAQEASQALGRPAKIRPHPKTLSSWEPQLPTLENTFEETYAAVSYTSTAAVAAAIAGVPCVTLHPASPAYDIGSSDFQLVKPHRGDWIHQLSWRNYRLRDVYEAANYIQLAYEQAAAEAAKGHLDTEGLRV